jgi:multidrug efflux system outer membrane protein
VYARIEAADATAQASLAQYHQTVLNALEETENALVNYRQERDKHTFLARAVDANEKANHLAQLRYDAGSLDLLEIQESALRVLQSQRQLAQSDTAMTTALIAIYKSLGGGWENLPEAVRKPN